MFKLIVDGIKVFVIFTSCTLMFYYGMIWINQEYQQYHNYEEPSDGAIKVMGQNKEEVTWKDRIFLFFLNGE